MTDVVTLSAGPPFDALASQAGRAMGVLEGMRSRISTKCVITELQEKQMGCVGFLDQLTSAIDVLERHIEGIRAGNAEAMEKFTRLYTAVLESGRDVEGYLDVQLSPGEEFAEFLAQGARDFGDWVGNVYDNAKRGGESFSVGFGLAGAAAALGLLLWAAAQFRR